MRNHSTLSILVLALLVAGPEIRAQQTLVVDERGGAGAQFTELPKAIAAANHGDLVLVRGGFYEWPTAPVSKGITIQGLLPSRPQITNNVLIAGVPAGRVFVLKDVSRTGKSIASCPGHVLIDSVDGGAEVTSCRSVHFRNCKDVFAVVRGSFVELERCGSSRITAQSSRVHLADTVVKGGQNCYRPSLCIPWSAIGATGSEILVRGESRLSVLVWRTNAVPVLDGDAASRLTIDPAIPLVQPSTSTPKIRGFGAGVVRRSLPTLRDSGTPVRGQLWSYTIASRARDPFAIAIGLPVPPYPIFGQLAFLDPTSLNVIHMGQQPARGESTFTFRHLTQPDLRGAVFLLQGIAGSSPQLTNAISISVR